eukprot:365149-Chlamydomonas_euryale.AAC.1
MVPDVKLLSLSKARRRLGWPSWESWTAARHALVHARPCCPRAVVARGRWWRVKWQERRVDRGAA